MKCPKCGMTMKREKKGEHQYSYKCPKCGFEIGGKKAEASVFNEAYNSMMGKG
jgi:tRNA(Ile2) C34 agmatinyltransferase TiaS